MNIPFTLSHVCLCKYVGMLNHSDNILSMRTYCLLYGEIIFIQQLTAACDGCNRTVRQWYLCPCGGVSRAESYTGRSLCEHETAMSRSRNTPLAWQMGPISGRAFIGRLALAVFPWARPG